MGGSSEDSPASEGAEPVAWRVRVRRDSMTMHTYTERLPFEPLDATVVLDEPVPLYTHPSPTEAKLREALLTITAISVCEAVVANPETHVKMLSQIYSIARAASLATKE